MAERKIDNGERLSQARQSLREARGELSAEAQWLRETLSPGRIAHRAVDRHTPAVLLACFSVGLLAARMIFHKKAEPRPYQRVRQEPLTAPGRNALFAGLGLTLAKAAMPFVLKFATSKPFVSSILEYAAARRARPNPNVVT